ncbi:hypothetical protein [Candidatus Rhabdochlamydia porcellionis]|uniref:Uncharacterized protein n=1 Tax=Candidatus Rhabdochlamydia porcellionis TaxID=225148 RepID=A0ABX8Z069_9BACT|nr:hypothetical protein [Candidatus Rhabdochlamydia porcellionis]QZA59065.1 hypothetical protein RHAB15C_0000949 [Candidatus Rhabdochlamydia porcellionis]
MVFYFNTITSNFNRTKAVLATGVNQSGYQVLRACKATAKISDLCLKKVVKSPFLVKNLFIKRVIVNDSPPLTQQEVIVEPLKGPNPLMEDIYLKEIVMLYKQLNSKVGGLVERVVDQAGRFLEKMTHRKLSIEALPSLDRVDFGKLIDPSLQMTQKFFPQEFLNLTNRNKGERRVTEKLESLLACLQHFEIPHFKLSKTFTPSDVESMTKQLKLIDKGVRAFIVRKIDLSGDECCMLVNARESINELQSLLKEYQKDVNKPIDEEDRVFAKDTIKNNPLVTKVVSPTIITLGSVATPLITIDGVPYLMSSLKSMISFSQENVLFSQNATIATASYALAANCAEEEQEEHSLLHMIIINSLLNQVAVSTFAYIGAHMCGSKIKVKEFIQQRISSVLVYKTCNSGLEYLGALFWPSKAISAIVSSLANRILH